MSTNEDEDDEPFWAPDPSIPIDPSLVYEDSEPNSPIHYNLRTISYSSILTFHSCPRKFELNRLIPRQVGAPAYDEDSAGHLDFGTIVGNGVEELLVSRDMNRAIFRAFLDWKDNLESERGQKSKKTFWHAVLAIQKFTELLNGPLSQYDVAVFKEKPATELGFRIDVRDGFTYRGKLDALLIHRTRHEYLPLECKTTGVRGDINEASYGNSAQGIGYGIVIDRVAYGLGEEVSNSYKVFYPVYNTFRQEWHPLHFPKDNTARALWLQSLMFDVQHIQEYAEQGYFPQHGESCMSFNRVCRYYGVCHLSNDILLPPRDKLPIELDKRDKYPLQFSIEELVLAQREKE